MNLVIDESRIALCVIVETKEEKYLYPVYDSDDKENLNILDSYVGLGKFYGWKDTETDKIYKSREEAYIKPKTPYELFGIECDKGWTELIKPLFEYVENYNKTHEDNQIEITQVKEKFGGLRFYVDNAPDELHKMIDKAEAESYTICEVCGTKENVGHTQGWIKTICRDCLEKQLKNSSFKTEEKWRPIDSKEVILIKKEDL